MADAAISIDGLSKRYRIGRAQEARYKTMRESLAGVIRSPRPARSPRQEVWALRDVSLELEEGKVTGIIGPNGAGKSTLLKVLSRITAPTEGTAVVRGRVGSLLEVGTGFHNELTGRENIYLNGAILGMRKREVERKFDEIVDFAEVARFIDTPIKRYSTGMQTRLAFAVAAHMETEILLVDEVLAVGDAAFQQRCMSRMGDAAREGRTILFVSHNMGAIRSLCHSAVLLQQGRIQEHGRVGSVISSYYGTVGAERADDMSPPGNHEVFGPVSIRGAHGFSLEQSEQLILDTTLHLDTEVPGFSLFCILEDAHGAVLMHQKVESNSLGMERIRPGSYSITVALPPLWLNPGIYTAYFKVLPWAGFERSRYVSEKIPVDVGGLSSAIDTLLHPRAEWTVLAQAVARRSGS